MAGGLNGRGIDGDRMRRRQFVEGGCVVVVCVLAELVQDVRCSLCRNMQSMRSGQAQVGTQVPRFALSALAQLTA